MSLPASQIKAHKILKKNKIQKPSPEQHGNISHFQMLGLKCFQPLPMLPTFYPPLETTWQRQASLLCSQSPDFLLYRALTRVLLGQRMWYDHLPQTLSGRKLGEDDSKQLPTPAGLLQEQLVWICVWTAALPLLLFYLGHGLSCTLPQHLFWQVCKASGPA